MAHAYTAFVGIKKGAQLEKVWNGDSFPEGVARGQANAEEKKLPYWEVRDAKNKIVADADQKPAEPAS